MNGLKNFALKLLLLVNLLILPPGKNADTLCKIQKPVSVSIVASVTV